MKSINSQRYQLSLAKCALLALIGALGASLVVPGVLGLCLTLYCLSLSVYYFYNLYGDVQQSNASAVPKIVLVANKSTSEPPISNSMTMAATCTSNADFSWVAKGSYVPNRSLYPAACLLLTKQIPPHGLRVSEAQAKQIASNMQYISEVVKNPSERNALQDLLLFDALARDKGSPIKNCIQLVDATLGNELNYCDALLTHELHKEEVGALKTACQQVVQQQGKGRVSDFFDLKAHDLYNSNIVCGRSNEELEACGEDKELLYTYMIASSFIRHYVDCKKQAQALALQTQALALQTQAKKATPLQLNREAVLGDPKHYPYTSALYALFPSKEPVWVSLDDQRQIQQDLEKLLVVYGNDITDARLCMVKDLLLVAHLALLASSPIAGMYSNIKATLNFALEAQVDGGVDTEPLVSNHIFGSAQSAIGHMAAYDLYNSKKMHRSSDYTAFLQCVDKACDGKTDHRFKNALRVPNYRKYDKLSKNNLLHTKTEMIHGMIIKSCLLQSRMDQLSLMHSLAVPSR